MNDEKRIHEYFDEIEISSKVVKNSLYELNEKIKIISEAFKMILS